MSWPATAALCAVAVVALPQAATARGFFDIEAPESFPSDEPLSQSIAREAARAPHFGERPTDSGADAYAAQGEGALYVWWAKGAPTDDSEGAIRAAFDRIRHGPLEASPQAGSVAIDQSEETTSDGVASLEFEWRHLSNETLTLVRALAFAAGDGAPRIVAAECVMHVTRENDVRPMCEAALASLAITVDASQRGSLEALPEGEPVEVSTAVPDLASELGADGEPSEEPASDDGPRIDAPQEGVLYEEQGAEGDGGGAPWLLLGGVLLVAAAAYFTLRRRATSGGDSRTERGGDERDE